MFTPRNRSGFQIIEAFSKALADLISQFNQESLPKLVLNGDILGLSFSDYVHSFEIFEAFIEACTIKNILCDTIIYIPGNHDHHIWNLAKEGHFLKGLENTNLNKIEALHSVTPPTFTDGFSSNFLDAFAKRIGNDSLTFKIFYPNFMVPPPEQGGPYLLFHHGHFSEKTYYFVSKFLQTIYPELPTPENLEELESQNGPFIDFAFSELGRSGKAGHFFEKLMSTLSNKELFEIRVDEMAENIAKNVDFPYLPSDWLEKQLAKTLLQNIGEKVRGERYKGSVTCSDETIQGLLHYLNTYCSETLSENGWSGEDVTLIWGHTHKPFQKQTTTDHFPKLTLYNSGGWVLPRAVTPVIGASILFVSDSNETQSLRIYNDAETGGKMHFEIIQEDGFEITEFSKKINEGIRDETGALRKEWKDLKSSIISEIKERRKDVT